MEAVILCGVQGSGKTTLYRDRFLETHVRVSMDLLRTRAREAAFLKLCLETQACRSWSTTRTRPSPSGRATSRPLARRGSRSWPTSSRSTTRSRRRSNAARARVVPASALRDVARRLVRPAPEEGIDELWHATAGIDGWRIEPLLTTPPLF